MEEIKWKFAGVSDLQYLCVLDHTHTHIFQPRRDSLL